MIVGTTWPDQVQLFLLVIATISGWRPASVCALSIGEMSIDGDVVVIGQGVSKTRHGNAYKRSGRLHFPALPSVRQFVLHFASKCLARFGKTPELQLSSLLPHAWVSVRGHETVCTLMHRAAAATQHPRVLSKTSYSLRIGCCTALIDIGMDPR
mgnify:CR=1 FL=1